MEKKVGGLVFKVHTKKYAEWQLEEMQKQGYAPIFNWRGYGTCHVGLNGKDVMYDLNLVADILNRPLIIGDEEQIEALKVAKVLELMMSIDGTYNAL